MAKELFAVHIDAEIALVWLRSHGGEFLEEFDSVGRRRRRRVASIVERDHVFIEILSDERNEGRPVSQSNVRRTGYGSESWPCIGVLKGEKFGTSIMQSVVASYLDGWIEHESIGVRRIVI